MTATTHRRAKRITGPAEVRFWPKVNKTNGCWLWTAASNTTGYGVFSDGGRTLYAHRVSYELSIGPVPDGLHLDHLCRTPLCVRPDHLEPVTPAENVRRGLSGPKSHCGRGHEYTPENTWVSRRGGRECRACHAFRERRRKAR